MTHAKSQSGRRIHRKQKLNHGFNFRAISVQATTCAASLMKQRSTGNITRSLCCCTGGQSHGHRQVKTLLLPSDLERPKHLWQINNHQRAYLLDVGLLADVYGPNSLVFADNTSHVGYCERRVRHLPKPGIIEAQQQLHANVSHQNHRYRNGIQQKYMHACKHIHGTAKHVCIEDLQQHV